MEQTAEFLILADGRILVHNVTPTMAAILSDLNPADELMRERAQAAVSDCKRADELSRQ
jgi:hypothetical protein